MSFIKRQIENENPELFRGPGLVERLSSDDRLSEIEQEQFADRVREEEERILSAEGAVHVGGVYYPSLMDARTQRQLLAEKNVREKFRAREIALRSEVRRAS